MNLLHKLTLFFLLPISISAADRAEIAAMRAKIRASIQQHRPGAILKQAREHVQQHPSWLESQACQESLRKYIRDTIHYWRQEYADEPQDPRDIAFQRRLMIQLAIRGLSNQEIDSSLDEMIGHAQINLASSSSEEDESSSTQEID